MSSFSDVLSIIKNPQYSDADIEPAFEAWLKQGTDLMAQDENGWTLLHWLPVVNRAHAASWIIRLINAGVNPHLHDLAGNTPLHCACMIGKETPYTQASLLALLKLGANPNALNNARDTPLHKLTTRHAAKSVFLIKTLCAHGLNVRQKNARGNTVFQQLFSNWLTLEHVEMCLALLEVGGVEPRTEGVELLWHAVRQQTAQEKWLPLIQALLEKGVNPNATYRQGETPMHAAALRGNQDHLALLFKYGGDPNLLDNKGHSVLDKARLGVHQTMLTQAYEQSTYAQGVLPGPGSGPKVGDNMSDIPAYETHFLVRLIAAQLQQHHLKQSVPSVLPRIGSAPRL